MGPLSRARTSNPNGFTLVEILMVLVIVGILLAMAAVLTRGVSAAQKRSLTATRLAGVDAALVQFVMQQRRLPCPADGTIASGLANAGAESCALGNQVNGVVPWVALGIPEVDATDGWDRRFTYRVDPNLVVVSTPGAMDMSSCDPVGGTTLGPGSSCVSPCPTPGTSCTNPTSYLIGKGLTVKDAVGNTLMTPPTAIPSTKTGAAYVVISHGETGGGAYLNSGTLTTSTTIDGTEEQKNYVTTPVTQPYYLDDSVSGLAGPSHFDDIVSRPSVLAVITKAALGPRSH
jgi:prepilin-type N-terminal cleavage/methylation domain-containing protein